MQMTITDHSNQVQASQRYLKEDDETYQDQCKSM